MYQTAGMRALGRQMKGGWFQHGFEDSVNSGAEKRLLETKIVDWSFCVHTTSSYAVLHQHTPTGARRVGGCSSDRRKRR